MQGKNNYSFQERGMKRGNPLACFDILEMCFGDHFTSNVTNDMLFVSSFPIF